MANLEIYNPRQEYSSVTIDISKVPELHQLSQTADDVIIGAMVSLERLRSEFTKLGEISTVYEKAASFLARVGSIAMRNQG